MRTLIRLVATLVIGAGLAACSGLPSGGGDTGGDDGSTRGPGGDGSSTAVGPGISIEEAINSDLDRPLLVNGYLVISNLGEMRLCSALAESYPPQCAGESLRVRGLDLATLDADADMQSADRTSWSEAQIQLLGTVEDGTITVETNSMP